jgi:hypothetical protein
VSIEVIYLDMDGVLADFVTPSLKVAGIPLTHDQVTTWNYFEPYMTADKFWGRIDGNRDFWFDLEPYPWAEELVNLCRSIAPVRFCSSPPLNPISATHKIRWLRWHGFMDYEKNDYHFTPHKHELAKPGRVLIDDSTANCLAFQKATGQAIEFPQPWNGAGHTISEQGDYSDRVTYVKRWLKFMHEPLTPRNEAMAAEFVEHVKANLKPADDPKEDILDIASRITRGDRQSSYGPPDQDFRRTADMITAMLRHKLADGQQFETWEIAQMMIVIKLSRLQHSKKRDSVVDIAGYARCMDVCYDAAGGYQS